jgi:signal transduction histidine kinase
VDQFEMRVTQKRLEKDSELNQQMCQQKDDILNTISHDLKGALSTIVGLSEMLLEYLPKEADEDCVKMVENIHHSGEASVKLLQDVLQWSICQGQQCEYQPKKIPLKEVINDALDLVVANFMQKEQTFQVNCPEAMYVMGDRQMIFSIIQNLLCNACKFTPENGRIYVTVDQENGTAKVRVTDTGKGVEPEQLKAIQKGKRAISMRGTNGEKGTGFGLMLCRQFVEKQNGRFEVRSELEKGTEFSFTIPVS